MSQEGTTQGASNALVLNQHIMIQSLRALTPEVKQVLLADRSAGGGRIVPLYSWYKHLCQEGNKFGYLVNGSKSWLIVKSPKQADEAERLFGQEVNIKTEGKRHLGAVIGSQEYKDQYCHEKVQGWKREIELLAEIAKSQPHAAYMLQGCAYNPLITRDLI